jgi:hypothetical protein
VADPLKMSELAQAVEDAAVIVRTGLGRARNAELAWARDNDVSPAVMPEDRSLPAIGFELVLQQLLDYEYTRDLP